MYIVYKQQQQERANYSAVQQTTQQTHMPQLSKQSVVFVILWLVQEYANVISKPQGKLIRSMYIVF